MDRIPSLLEAPRETLDTLTMPEPVKIGGAEFPIRLVADEDIKSTDQNGIAAACCRNPRSKVTEHL